MTTPSESYSPTARTQVKRMKKRAAYDKATVHAILDEALIGHVGFVVDGHPRVIPTIYVRDGETLYFHGSGASRMLRTLEEGVDVCLTATLIDSMVLARSAFHHSVNYRSVVVMGKAHLVADRKEMLHALKAITNRVVPRRWDEVREPNELELKQTHVLALPLNEVSAKIRNSPPIDDEEDYSLAVWAGLVPIETRLGNPIPDARISPAASPLDISRFAVKDTSSAI